MPSFARFGNDLYTGERSIDFIGRRKLWYAIAAVAIAISGVALGVRGLNPGIEFRGGTEFRVSNTTITSEQAAVDAVHKTVPRAEVRVSRLNNDSVRVQSDGIDSDQLETVKKDLATAYKVDATKDITSSFVGPTWGADVTRQAVIGLFVFLLLVSAVIALYFRTWKMAVAALVALIHDLILTVGVYALVGFEVTPASVIGFLTILGYSLYDTVVVFDKVRENTEHIVNSTKRTFGEAANLAVNQTLVRSINTSVVALLPVAAILFIGAFLLGAGTLKDIALSLFVGIAAGTYSSIFIATPLLVHLREGEPELRQQASRVARRRSEEGSGATTSDEPQGTLAAVGSGTAGAAAASSGGSASAGSAPGGSASGGSASGGSSAGSSGGQRQQPRRSAGRSGRPGAGGRPGSGGPRR